MAHFHRVLISNQNQSITILVNFHQTPKVIALLLGQYCSLSPLFNLPSKSINFNSGHLSSKTKGYSLTFWPKLAHFHHCLISNQNQSISILVICHQNAKVIALFLGKIGSFSPRVNLQSKSINFNSGRFSSKTKGYSLTAWPILAHYHHCLISHQNQSISILVICHQTPKVIALLVGQNWLIFTTF